MIRVTLTKSLIRAVSRFSAKEDVRYYLKGVHVECHANVAYIVGTNGHFLAVARIERGEEDYGHGAFIVPRELCESLKVSRHQFADTVTVTVEQEGEVLEERRVTIACPCDKTELTGSTIAGKFPDWRKVIPEECDGTAANYSSEYLALMAKAAKDLGYKGGGNGYSLAQNGENGALVTFWNNPEMLAVIMPVRADPELKAPEWTREDSAAAGRILDVEEAQALALEHQKAREEDGAANDSESADAQGFRVEYFAA